MPNWCYNRLVVDTTTDGGKILADAFRPKHKDDDGNLYATPMMDLHPFPKELDVTATPCPDDDLDAVYKANVEKFGAPNWYKWCIDNWGTKWDARVEDYDDEDSKQTYIYFETAWSPPTDFFEWFCKQHPDTIFDCEYDEEGCSFEGKTSNHPDQGFHDDCWHLEEEEEDA